jgi:hypothetical protein
MNTQYRLPKFGELPQSMVYALREADAEKRDFSDHFAGPIFAGSCLAKPPLLTPSKENQ